MSSSRGFGMCRAGFRCHCSLFTCKETMWEMGRQCWSIILAGIGEHGVVERGLRCEGCSDGMNPPLLPLPTKIRAHRPSKPVRWTPPIAPVFSIILRPKLGTMTMHVPTYSHFILIALGHSYSQGCQQERDHSGWLGRWVTVFLVPLASSCPTPWLPVGLGFHRLLAGQGDGMGKLLRVARDRVIWTKLPRPDRGKPMFDLLAPLKTNPTSK